MTLHTHTVRNDRLKEISTAAGALGALPIATAATWPLAQLRRTMRTALETFEEENARLLEQYTEHERDASGAVKLDHNDRPIPRKVYAVNDDGSPKYRLDDAGQPTAERAILPGQILLTDMLAYDRALRALLRQTVTVHVPHVQWAHVESKVRDLDANTVEALLDFLEQPAALEAPTSARPVAKGRRAR